MSDNIAEVTSNQTKGAFHTIECHSCKQVTPHHVLQSVEKRIHGLYGSQWYGEYQIIQCQECESISFRQQECNCEDQQPAEIADFNVCQYTVYPSRASGTTG